MSRAISSTLRGSKVKRESQIVSGSDVTREQITGTPSVMASIKGKLPASILNRPKRGLDIPAQEWLRGPLLSLLQETLSPEAVRATGLLDEAVISKLIRDHSRKLINAGYQLWGLLTLFLWLKQWDVEIIPPGEESIPEPTAPLVAAS